MCHIIFQFLCLYWLTLGVYGQNPELVIPQGRLRGNTRINLDGGVYYSFKRIPYAKPPIGERRFKAPQPADAWNGTLDATQEIPQCVQLGGFSGQEDCLYLNVYTPGLPVEGVNSLAVMVWIHGGAYYAGSAVESTYGAQFLLTKDIVLVTLNYRVGIFGFLSLDDVNLGVTGNAGMKDQVLALEWVRDNIQYFGGDANNVLIFGQSAGGSSVQLLLLSPMATGLFNKVIAQSGDSLTPYLDISRNNGAAIAERLGIQTENWEDMLESLQGVRAGDLAIAEMSFNTNIYKLLAAPIIEIPTNGSFLERRPIDIIRSGDYNQVPLMTGVTDAEGLLFEMLMRMYNGETILIDDFTNFIPYEFNIAPGTLLEELIANIIKFFYNGDTEPSRDNITAAVQLTGDYFFGFPCYRSAREYLKTAENPIYFYYFTAITELSSITRNMYQTIATYPGAGHADDIFHLFNTSISPTVQPGSVEDRVLMGMVDMWTNFAIYGNPTPAGSDFVWESLKENQFNYVEIGNDSTFAVLDAVYTPERMEFWWALYEQYARNNGA